MGANELSSLLWHERELLDLLVFKLEEEQLLLTTGKTRWLQHATREVEQVVQRLRLASLGRAVEVAALARSWGIEGDPSLAELADGAADPWEDIFRAHLEALTAQTGRIKQLRDANEMFLRTSSRSTQETLSNLQPEPGTYDVRGTTGPGAQPGARLFDATL